MIRLFYPDREMEEIDGSGADGLAAQRVIAAGIESLETGRIIFLSAPH